MAQVQFHRLVGLDYFGFRYYSGAQGRWTSPDPIVHPSQSQLNEEDYLADPQRWNKYAYALNNPLRFTDPDGAEVLNYSGATVRSPLESPGSSFRRGIAAGALAGGAVAAGFAPEIAGGLRALGSALLGWALSNPDKAQQAAVAAVEQVSGVPMPNLASTFGFAKVEGTIEGFTYGRLANGAEVAAQFAQSGSNVTVSVLGAFNAGGAKSVAGTIGAIEAGAQAVAKSQGATSLTLQAVAVTNQKLGALLIKQGFKETTIKVGKEVVKAYEKTVEVR